MSLEQFKTLVDQFRRTLYTLDLSMWGDPLIVPDIFKMVAHAHRRGIWTYLSSNLHAFKPEKAQGEILVNSGLDMLTCSLHGASQDTYEQYQPGKRFDIILNKVRTIVEAKRRLKSMTPAIQLNFVVTRFNEHEMDAFKKLARSLDCEPVFSSPSLNLRFVGKGRDLVDLGLADDVRRKKTDELMQQWLPDDERFVIEPYRAMKRGIHRDEQYNGHKSMDCQWPWKDAVINWDGSVVTCCGVFGQNDDLGNVFNTPFKEIWNSKGYRMARRSFRKPVEEPTGYANPCRECPGFLL